jgi:hypothetical protein
VSKSCRNRAALKGSRCPRRKHGGFLLHAQAYLNYRDLSLRSRFQKKLGSKPKHPKKHGGFLLRAQAYLSCRDLSLRSRFQKKLGSKPKHPKNTEDFSSVLRYI